MNDISIKRSVPQFIMQDRNGHAMAKAIEGAINLMRKTLTQSIDTMQDTDKMPEWRLDEVAKEGGILYDVNADAAQKRQMIRDMYIMQRLYGTPAAIEKYLRMAFPFVEVWEGKHYGGEPYHFRVIVEGKFDADKEKWARAAIEKTKNVRSVHDGIITVQSVDSGLRFLYGRIQADVVYPMCGMVIAGEE